MNTTHPDAKSREEREHDELIWLVEWSESHKAAFIVNANGVLIVKPVISMKQATIIVREHNRIVARILEKEGDFSDRVRDFKERNSDGHY